MLQEIVFATNNANKLRELQELVGDKFHILSLADINCHDEIEENGTTFEENAFIKARYIKHNYGYDCFADDSGLEVDALNGAPGVYSARYSGPHGNDGGNVDKLLHELNGVSNRAAHFSTVIALILDGGEHAFTGAVYGSIINERRGTNGFGYDPVFVPDGYDTTFAEMDSTAKNAISHRGQAVRKLVEFLNNK